MSGQVNTEQVITSNPDFYLMTGADWNRGNRAPKAVPLGYMADKAVAEQKLKGLTRFSFTAVSTLMPVRFIRTILR